MKTESDLDDWETRPGYYFTGEAVQDGDLVYVVSRGCQFLAYVDSTNTEDNDLTLVDAVDGELKYGADCPWHYQFDAWGWDDVILIRKCKADGNRASYIPMLDALGIISNH